MAKVKSIRDREDGGGIDCESAGCAKCDDLMPLLDDVHGSWRAGAVGAILTVKG